MSLVDSYNQQNTPPSGLVSWVMSHVSRWEDYRNSSFQQRWSEYYRLWRGLWSEQDRSRKSERSRFIAPALQQAIEASVAEQEEAVFGRERWVDVIDDVNDQTPGDTMLMLDQFLEDCKKANVAGAISEVFLNGALYGTGIAKVTTDTHIEKTLVRLPDGSLFTQEVSTIRVGLVPVEPKEFVIDPVARNVDDGLGCAHVTIVPTHSIISKQKSGVYSKDDGFVTDYTSLGNSDSSGRYGLGSYAHTGEQNLLSQRGMCKIVEWHGLIPKGYLSDKDTEIDEHDMVEAIVTIANDTVLLRAIKNPFVMQDRCFIAYSHDKVPNRFWGRGVAEKGYNPQKQLDTELRARIDALAFSVHPMMGMDASRVPRGEAFEVRPGRTVLTTGNPAEVLQTFNFPPPDPQTYRQSADMERMIQQGTGSMDSAVGTGTNPRNATASGMSMILAGSLKRSKRTMHNIERDFLRPFVKKALWRYMQFDEERYPAQDYNFTVHASLGIMAREVEQQLLISLASTTPPGTPAYWAILKAVFETSTIRVKDQVLASLEEMSNAPPPEPPPDPRIQVEMAKLQLEAQKFQHTQAMDIENLKLEYKKAQQRDIDLQGEMIMHQGEARRDVAEGAKFEADALLAQTKAQVAEAKAMIDSFKAQKEVELSAERNAIKEMQTLSDFMDKKLQVIAEQQKADAEEIKASNKVIEARMAELAKRKEGGKPIPKFEPEV